MIIPLITFNCLCKFNFTQTQKEKLLSISRRAKFIIYGTKNQSDDFIDDITQVMKQHACLVVKKSLDSSLCRNYDNYFKLLEHEQGTRNNGFLLRCPGVRLELAKSGFFFTGVKVFNQLPLKIRQIADFANFWKNIKKYIWK